MIPITSPTRTLLDLAALLDYKPLRRALRQAAWHDNRLARADDAERQALLEAHDERVLRVTWNQAIARPRQTLSRIRAAGAPAARDIGRR
jgi:hypothetical protein